MIDGRGPARQARARKNLVIIHLESVGWQQVRAFPDAFRNLHRLMAGGSVFANYYSSATSTKMALGYLLHGNDFEFDAKDGLGAPARNTPSLLPLLGEQGYQTAFLNFNAYAAKKRPVLQEFAGSIPTPFASHDFREILAAFERLISEPPFAVYIWNLMTHIEQSPALHPHAAALEDLVGGAHAIADHALGQILKSLARADLLDNTCIVAVGDHGEDFWTHGFKGGLLHGTEPYTSIIHTPLVISDPDLEAGQDRGLASTIDIMPTCLDLLGIALEPRFPDTGTSLLKGRQHQAFAQNFTAAQPDNTDWGIRKSFSATDASFTLMASSDGLELYNHRLDPTNHSNLLHFFTMAEDGTLRFTPPSRQSHHFRAVFGAGTSAAGMIAESFGSLRAALAQHVARKREYLIARGADPGTALDPGAFHRTSGRGAMVGGETKAMR